MKFVDEVRIYVKAGDGGKGAVAFRREKFIEKGGPCGGDGGSGGSVYFTADPQLTTLLDFRYQQHHRARSGENGMGADCNGHGGEDLELRVPVGTLIRDHDTGELLFDLAEAGQRVLVAKGGMGGLGNMNFATSTRQTPRFAQDGTPGDEITLRLELRLLADVGLLGFPNAGKSTLISVVSRARPKIADYPFTTLVPNLGMVQYREAHSFVMADIPGLIEGASDGAGLGLQFLRHVDRCKVLIHVVDLSAYGEDREPLRDYETINRELLRYSPELADKPQVIVASKQDIPEAKEKLAEFEAAMAQRGLRVYPISAATHEGLQPMLDAAARVLFQGDDSLLRVERPAGPAKAKAKATKAPAAAKAKSVKPASEKAAKAPAAAKAKAVKPASEKAEKTPAAAKAKVSKAPAAAKAKVAKAPLAAKAKAAPVKAPAKGKPSKAAPVKAKATKAAPVKAKATKAAPVKATKAAPVKAKATKAAPVKAKATKAAPVKAKATKAAPVKSKATKAAPVKSKATKAAPVKSKATRSAVVKAKATKSPAKAKATRVPAKAKATKSPAKSTTAKAKAKTATRGRAGARGR